MKSLKTASLILVLLAALVGCGGGGGGGSSASNLGTAAAPPAASSDVTSTVMYSANGLTYTAPGQLSFFVQFNTDMDATTLTKHSVTVAPVAYADGSQYTKPFTPAGTISYANRRMVYDLSNLDRNVKYQITLNGNLIKTASGTTFTGTQYSMTTTLAYPSDYVRPATIGATLVNGQSKKEVISITYDQKVDPASVSADQILVQSTTGIAVAGTSTVSDNAIIFTPSGTVDPSLSYIATVKKGVLYSTPNQGAAAQPADCVFSYNLN